ncbi:LysM peptidoglycan-binding domain-containing protein [Spirosoma sp. BT702]|uniref:LysM peptidoglycan-binding domain-containing protein n=1 Tax=Spirosoma profusum TaxID=2771354 RepID=A0A927GAP2_9BACT|nr:LysM peptidoglycan-binding domain-containing protein [Spirosoma profusum]MBD2705265.1 LysM peptidoglycan-binding domain-containing protein [Spirosoma profusum]
MEEETRTANPRYPGNSSLPAITLTVLVGMIAALLYIGYDYLKDDTNGSDELTNVALDTLSQQPLAQNDQDVLMAPEEVDTSSSPAPVDLSQAVPPADAEEANVKAEDVAADNRETTGGKPAPDEKPVVEKPKEGKPKEEKPVEKPKEEKPVEKPKPEPIVEKVAVNPGGSTNTHTVGAGETFYGVATRYNMKISTLKELNPGVSESDVKAGVTKLNVKVMAVHTVGPGDVLRVVAQKYGVSKEAIMRANKRQKDIATRGEKLIIPFPDKQ